jgi:hypothetical protein
MEEIISGIAIQDLLGASEPQQPQWILDRWASTDDGRIGVDIWWGMSGGNFSVDRGLFLDLGGYDEAGFKEWGGEDNELGYRIYQSGAFVVPIQAAMAWHLGPATNDSADIDARRRRIRIRLASRVASDALPRAFGVTFQVPDIAVELGSVDSFEDGVDRVSRVLSDSRHCVVRVSLGSSDPDEEGLLREYLRSEARVVVGDPDRVMRMAPITVRSSTARWPEGFVDWLSAIVGEPRTGILRIEATDGSLTAWWSRLLHQVEAGIRGEPNEHDAQIERIESWTSVLDQIASMRMNEELRLKSLADAAEARSADLSNRRAIQIADALGSWRFWLCLL